MLPEIELAGITLEDISLLDPESPQFKSLRSLATGSSRLAAGPEWVEFEEAIVYRWTGESVSAELTCDISSGELNEIWEVARKLSNQPALLIASSNRRVTFRFHPQRGPMGGFDEIRRAFPIALHCARPDCQIDWLD